MKIVRQGSPGLHGNGGQSVRGRKWRQRLVGPDGLTYKGVGFHAGAAAWKEHSCAPGRRKTPSFFPAVRYVGCGTSQLLLLFLSQWPLERRKPSAEGEGTC